MEYLDPVLVLVLLSQICVGICAWRSPRFLRNLAAQLLARADLMDIWEHQRKARPKYWRKKLGVEVDPRSTAVDLNAERLSRSEVKVS